MHVYGSLNILTPCRGVARNTRFNGFAGLGQAGDGISRTTLPNCVSVMAPRNLIAVGFESPLPPLNWAFLNPFLSGSLRRFEATNIHDTQQHWDSGRKNISVERSVFRAQDFPA